MDQTQPPTMGEPTPLFAERYEIAAQKDEYVEAIDRQPWKRCWACGATSNEAGELFCTECGAKMETAAQTIPCVKCGAALAAGSKFCNECGTKQGE